MVTAFGDGERDHLVGLDADTERWRRTLGETYPGNDGTGILLETLFPLEGSGPPAGLAPWLTSAP